jgi:hypothetical protein
MIYGSYENKQLLKKLHESGLKVDLKDRSGKMAIDYSRDQSSGIMTTYLS